MVLDPEILLSKWGTFVPWAICLLAMLAGFSVFPISIDILVALAALIAANYLPEQTALFFSLFTLGCIVAAWIAYSLGRFFGKFSKSTRVEKIASLHKRLGPLTFFVCRFIPFGVRNLFFISSGFSKYPFLKFALLDGLACIIWSSILFFSIYHLGQNLDTVLTTLKQLNLILFSLFAVVLLTAFIIYRIKKKPAPRQ